MTRPPYEKLYQDIEEGLAVELDELSASSSDPCDDDSVHDSPPFLSYRSHWLYGRFSPSQYNLLNTIKGHTAPHRRWILIVPLALFCLSTIAFLIWSSTMTKVFQNVEDAASFFGLSSILVWLRPGNGNPGLSYAFVPYDPLAPSPAALQSPASPYLFEILGILLDPSRLPADRSSGNPLLSRNAAHYFNIPTKFDVVWTWVNGSDPLHQAALAEAEAARLHKKRHEDWRRDGGALEPITERDIDEALQVRQATAPKLFR
jgi:hypothetical protein